MALERALRNCQGSHRCLYSENIKGIVRGAISFLALHALDLDNKGGM